MKRFGYARTCDSLSRPDKVLNHLRFPKPTDGFICWVQVHPVRGSQYWLLFLFVVKLKKGSFLHKISSLVSHRQ